MYSNFTSKGKLSYLKGTFLISRKCYNGYNVTVIAQERKAVKVKGVKHNDGENCK